MNEAERERPFRMIGYGVALTGVLLVAASAKSEAVWPRHISEPVRDIGIALLISALLALGLDRYLRENFVRQASRDVRQYLLGYGFPAAGQEKIKSILFDSPIILENFVAEYTLLPWEGSHPPELVRIRFTKRHDIVNNTRSTMAYNHGISVDAHEQPDDFSLECDSSEESGRYRLTRDEIGAKVAEARARQTGAIEVRYEIPIRPNSEAKDAIWYRVRASAVMTVPRNWATGIGFGSPVIGVTIRANCPGLRFDIYGASRRTTNEWDFRGRFFLGGEFTPLRWVSEE